MEKYQIGISIIIVNWNSKKFLEDCISSIRKFTLNTNYEIIIVDNASYDGSEEFSDGVTVKFIQLDKNMGFSKANNIGAQNSTMNTLLFLNPDTVLENAAIEMMYHELWKNEQNGAIGCKLLNTDGSLQTSCIMPYPSLFNLLFDIEYLKIKSFKFPAWGISSLFKDGPGPWQIEALSGACIMVKHETFKQINGFSEEYFMYAEDLDLCMKINRTSSKNLYLPQAIITHHGGGATGSKRPGKFSTVLSRESMYILLQKFHGVAYSESYKKLMVISAIIRIVLLFPFLLVSFLTGKKGNTYNTFEKWCFIFSWGIGKEKWCKQPA